MDIRDIDLNLLRLFDAVYRLGNVSRAAASLDLSQPAASQGLSRLRRQLHDALFVRAPGGVRPTPRGRRLAIAIQSAIATIEGALNEVQRFEPAKSEIAYRFSLTDIGESHMLSRVMATLRREAPGIRVESLPVSHTDIRDSLDSGVIDFAMGFLPSLQGTQRAQLMQDRYVLLLRADHPFLERRARATPAARDLSSLYFIGVRSHPETVHILQTAGLNDRIRLTASHLLAAASIVEATDLAVLIPRTIARRFAQAGTHAFAEPGLPHNELTVSLHWSKRFEADPAHAWMRQLLMRLFRSRQAA